jgi:hypothetical protein
MTPLEWGLSISLFMIYVSLLVTVAVMTFRKGRWLLGIVGFLFPILWLIGAVLPAKPGSSYDIQERTRWQSGLHEMTR